MLIKSADDKNLQLALLEQRSKADGSDAKHAKGDYHKLKAGIRGENDAAYLINNDYGSSSKNWCVIHDLRLEHDGRVAQIDHLLINRWMDFYVLESKHFNSGVKINERGEFERWNEWKRSYEGMPSPLEQNERHIQVLRDILHRIELPTRLGLKITPNFYSFILVNSSARIILPKKFDVSRVIKADQLKKYIQRDINETSTIGTLASVAKIVSSETMENVAKQLVALHKPLLPATSRQFSPPATTLDSPVVTTPLKSMEAPICKACKGNKGSIEYGKYGYYFKCEACGENTSQKQTCKPGHEPRLRKDKSRFFRECPQCGTSTLYFTNPAS
jgi:hypothetical protein